MCDKSQAQKQFITQFPAIAVVFGQLVLIIWLTGCAVQPETAVINLSNLEPLAAAVSTEVVPLRVAVAAVISPQGNVDSYGPLLDYLSDQLDRPVELVQRRTYAEINDLIEAGDVDMAFVCTSAYVAGARDFGMELLAAPQVNGETVYYSVLLVPENSPAQDIADLRGGIFAFTDPMSNTGRNYPTSLVQQFDETPDRFFGRTFYTYSHDDAIRAVANHVADGAAVDSLVYEHLLARSPELGQHTRVIHRSPPFGIPPVVVGPHVRPQLAAQLQTILIHMADDLDGQAALVTAGFERFVPITDSAYDSVRELEESVAAMP